MKIAHTAHVEAESKGVIAYFREKGPRAYGALADRKYTTVAGTLVFFLLLSIVPLLFFVALFFGESISAEQIFELELFDWAQELIVYLNAHATGASVGANVFFLATTFWSGTGFFYHLRRGGEIVYGIQGSQKGWRLRVSAVLFTLFMLVFITFAGGVVIGTDLLTRSLAPWVSSALVYFIITLIGFFTAWILNAYACPYRAASEMAAGSAFTALSWIVASALFRIYLKFSNPARLYGALSAIVVFLLFLYWLMICFTVGMIYNCKRIRIEGRKTEKRF